MQELHVHGVYGGEDGCAALYDALPGLGHGDGGAGGQEDGLVAAAQGQETHEVTLHKHHLQRKQVFLVLLTYK